MIYILLINIILIFWIYRKYVYIPKNIEQTIEVQELEPALLSCIYNENGNSLNWILAEILDLNRKDYIDIEYNKKDINQYEYVYSKKENVDVSKMKKYEIAAYRLLFDENRNNKITMDELENLVVKSKSKEKDANVKSLSIKTEVIEELIKLGIIDEKSQKCLKMIKIIYLFLIIISVVLLIKAQIDPIILTIFLIENITIFTIANNGRAFSSYGKKVYRKVKEYRNYLEENELLKDRELVYQIVSEKYYIDAVALHLTEQAQKEFINDELKAKQIKDVAVILILIILIILYVLQLIL